jgi:hypothetical protein
MVLFPLKLRKGTKLSQRKPPPSGTPFPVYLSFIIRSPELLRQTPKIRMETPVRGLWRLNLSSLQYFPNLSCRGY